MQLVADRIVIAKTSSSIYSAFRFSYLGDKGNLL